MSLKTVSICIVKADGTVVWEGKALSEPASLIKALVAVNARGPLGVFRGRLRRAACSEGRNSSVTVTFVNELCDNNERRS